ncbi:MAG: nitroreductase family protein [Acidobacteriota bacterium]
MKTLDFYELISKRRSIRAYDPEKSVSDETIKKILEAGRLAPTASNRQPATFHLVKDTTLIKKIHSSYSREWFHKSTAVLIVTGKREDAWARSWDGFNSLEIDLSIMMDHMILAAEYEGVATCWIIAFEEAVVKKALNLHENELVLCMTPLGYPPEGYQKRGMPDRKSLDELLKIY